MTNLNVDYLNNHISYFKTVGVFFPYSGRFSFEQYSQILSTISVLLYFILNVF